ncbi:MAG: O-antigen ligase family protein [Flavobacteriales bacterium]
MLGTLFFASWYNESISVGGKDIIYFGEILGYMILLVVVSLRGWKLGFPKMMATPFLLLALYFIGHLVYSSIYLSGGQALSMSRDFLLYPLLGILIGYNLQLTSNKEQLENSIRAYFKFLLVIAVANFLLKFKPMQEYGLINRPDGMILSYLVFGYMLDMYNRRPTNLSPMKLLFVLILIFFTSSRGVYLAVLLSSGLIFRNNMRQMSTKVIRVVFFGGAGLGLLLVALLSFENPVRTGVNKFTNDIVNISDGNLGSYGDQFNTLGGRYYLYQSVFNLGMESPIVGKGLGFSQKSWYLGGDYDTYREKTPHNYYLMLWYKTGLIGMVLFAFFYFKLLKALKELNPAVFYYSVAVLIYAGVDVILFGNKPAIIAFFVIAGMGLATKKGAYA